MLHISGAMAEMAHGYARGVVLNVHFLQI